MELLAQSTGAYISREMKRSSSRNNFSDTIALLADVQSVSNLFALLSLFEKCSGLKIRVNQSKSEMPWLGSMRHRKEAIFNL